MTRTDTATLAEQIRLLLANKGYELAQTSFGTGVFARVINAGAWSTVRLSVNLGGPALEKRVISELITVLEDAGYTAERDGSFYLYVSEAPEAPGAT